jgi:NitT/TauT family transport system substrate-binding protein
MPTIQTRRRFLTTLSLAGAAGLVRAPQALAEEGLPETTSLRFAKSPSICIAPQDIADELLRAEGFTDIRYLPVQTQAFPEALAGGEVDLGLDYASKYVDAIDRGLAITVLAGAHVGCFELFGNESVRNITDLKGKKVGVVALGSPGQVFLALIAAQVGLDPGRDINWVINPSAKPIQLFVDGKTDAFLGFPPDPQELRAQRIGHVVVNSAIDRPWSQYFCCMLAGNREFVRKYPVATKRAARAILKAADLCVNEPARAARRLVDGGFTGRYDYALQTLRELPYDKWREFDAEDTIRFYALRMHEAGFIKSSPQKIIAEGTDWRFLNELKRELKT